MTKIANSMANQILCRITLITVLATAYKKMTTNKRGFV